MAVEGNINWMDMSSLPRQDIGVCELFMPPYHNPDDDTECDPDNVCWRACENLARIGLELQALGDQLDRSADRKDGVLVVGALAVTGWQVCRFRERVYPQLKALREFNPCLRDGIVKCTGTPADQRDGQMPSDSSIRSLGAQFKVYAKELYAAYKSREDARLRHAFTTVEEQCELLPDLLKAEVENYFYNRIDSYQFPEAFGAAFAQLFATANPSAESPEALA